MKKTLETDIININHELLKLKPRKDLLEKKDIDLIITDFDDTIFSRKQQLESDENLRKYRGEQGNLYIKEIIGIKNFVNKYYKNKTFPKIITNKLRLNHDLILTAGMPEFSSKKIKTTGLDIYNFIIVEKAEMKILETIKYVVENLGFIPKKITIYEDRPKYFIANKETIEKFLGTQLEIMYVEMIDNDTNPKITKIS